MQNRKIGFIIIIMVSIQNLVEYYDELYPVSEAQKKFYNTISLDYQKPVRYLRTSCGAGLFEHLLARDGADVTGIEYFPELLRSANLRRRNQLMAIRFFQMSELDMGRFLGKGFYNILSNLSNRIIYIHDKTLLRKFFFDSRQLLSEDGKMVLEFYNYDKFNSPGIFLPQRESLRTKLTTRLDVSGDGQWVVNQTIETGSGRILPVMENEAVFLPKPAEIELFAREAGFSSVQLYSDFEMSPFTGNEDTVIALIS